MQKPMLPFFASSVLCVHWRKHSICIKEVTNFQKESPFPQTTLAYVLKATSPLHRMPAESSPMQQAIMQNLHNKDANCLASFRAEVLELRKYAVLNSTAAIKAVKKRNRHLRACVGSAFQVLRATDFLSQQHFFTSPKLASLSTQAEILARVSHIAALSISLLLCCGREPCLPWRALHVQV